MRRLAFCVALPVLLSGGVGQGIAETIPVANPSFEADVLSDDTWIGGAPTGWYLEVGDVGAGVWNPIGSKATDGDNVAFSTGNTISQVLSSTLEPDKTYVMEVDVAREYVGSVPIYEVMLFAGPFKLAEQTGGISENDWDPFEWFTVVVTYTALPGDSNLGRDLVISLHGGPTLQSDTLFDNVRLTANVVPAPSTPVALLGMGAVGLVRFGWRRRRKAIGTS